MDRGLAERIERRLAATGQSAREASLAMGLSDGYIRNILTGKSQSPRGENLARLARQLGTTEVWLLRMEGEEEMGDDVRESRQRPGPASEAYPASIPIPDFAALPRDVPVYGSASGGMVSVPGRGGQAIAGFTIDTSKATEFVRRPPALAGAPDVYAIYVADDSMAPQHSAGDLRFVHPSRPPRGGDTVLILVRAGDGVALQAFVKRYIGRSAGGTSAEQINPPAVVTFKPETVVGVHRVLTMNELFTG